MAARFFSLGRVCLLMMVVCTSICTAVDAQQVAHSIFDVMKYGAVADGKLDNSQAFLRAWKDACQMGGRSTVVIPTGIYMVHNVYFVGPCNGSTEFNIKGDLKAPTEPSLFLGDHWIMFKNVDRLVVNGGGIVDGQGAFAWRYPNNLPASLWFQSITNSWVHHIRSQDAKNIHINVQDCKNLNLTDIQITAPGDSHNTDGIHIGGSSNIRIENSIIGTGDDCISMVAGSQNIDISNVVCAPGHGISVGSLGKVKTDSVGGITARNCTFRDTMNGVRIKTWAPSLPAVAEGFVFQDLFMDNVSNPIIIDQQYCPESSCNGRANSQVQIRNVTFQNIWGTSRSKVAVALTCSGTMPCQNVRLDDINLNYNGREGPAVSFCSYAKGASFGKQIPPSCLE